MRSKKRSFLMSLTSLILCVAMLVGSTFAWFTDTVTSGANKIVAGNLDVEVSYRNGDNWTSIEGADSLFDKAALWEPGHTEFVTLKVENKGTLALKYKVNVSPISESGGINQAGESFKLSDYLVFGTTEPSEAEQSYNTREAARTAAGTTYKLNQAGLTQSGKLPAKAADTDPYPSQYITLVVYMPEEVGNAANYKTGTTAPQIELGITVVATQLENESDSFGTDYDKDATYDPAKDVLKYDYFPQVNVVGQLVIGANSKISKGSQAGGEVTVTQLEGEGAKSRVTMSSAEKVENADAAKVETILQKEEGEHTTGSMTLKVVKDDTANANFKTDSTKINTATQDSTTYQVTVETKGVVAVSDTDGKAKFKVDLFIGKNRTGVKMYHNDNLMNEATSGAVDTFDYSSETGYVTMYVDGFSPFTAVYDQPVAAIGTVVYYTLADAIAEAQNNDTIVLLSNTKENVTIPSEMTLTLDLNGKTLNGGTVAERPALTNNGTLTVTGNGTIVREDTGTSAYYVVDNQGTLTFENGTVSNGSGSTTVHAGASLIRNGEGMAYATLNIKDGTFTQPNFNVIKDAGNSEVNISGGTISCAQKYAVLTYGKLNITGGSVTGPISVVGYGDGDDQASGQATISGGTIDSAITVRQYTNNHATQKPSLTISGGTFGANTSFAIGEGKSDTELIPKEECGTISITGGTYNTDPSKYVAEGYEAIYDEASNLWKIQTYVPKSGSVEIPAGDTGYHEFTVGDRQFVVQTSFSSLVAVGSDKMTLTLTETNDTTGANVCKFNNGERDFFYEFATTGMQIANKNGDPNFNLLIVGDDMYEQSFTQEFFVNSSSAYYACGYGSGTTSDSGKYKGFGVMAICKNK